MQIIPNRRKDRILVRIMPGDNYTDMLKFDARTTQLLPTGKTAHVRWTSPWMVSIPVTTKTKAEMARKLRAKFKGLTGTIKWVRGEAS